TKAFVDLSSSNTSANSVYTIDFNTGQYGKLTANVSTIHIYLPQDTRFNPLSSITVNGQNAPVYATTNNPRNLAITTPINIENNSSVRVVITQLRNPAAQAVYSMDIYTSTEQTPVRSNAYNIGYTSLTNVSFTITSLGVNNTTQYRMDARTTANMYSNASISDFIRIILPEDVEIPASIGTGDITLRVGVTNRPIKLVNVSQANRNIDVYPDVNIGGNTNIRVTIPVGVGVRNPVVPSNSVYRGTVYTTADLEPVYTSAINYASNAVAAVLDTVTINPSIINATNSKYTIKFTTGANGRLKGSSPAGASYIEVLFPTNGTTVPASINAGDVLVNNLSSSQVTVLNSGSTNGRIRIYLAQNQVIEGNELVTIIVGENAGLVNGSGAGTYRLRVMTSSESTLSAKVNTLQLLSESSLEVPSLTVSPKAINSPAAFTVKIKPGFNKDVQIGETISIRFPNESTVPANIWKSYVLVNGVQPTIANSVNSKTLTITSPVLLAGETQATISISSLSGITNPPTVASTWRVYVTTTHELVEVASPTYTTELASSTIETPSVNLSNNAISQAATYTIAFQTGAQGALTSGSSIITIRMPNGTTYGALSATVNGVASGSVTRSGNDIMVQVPVSVSISSSSAVSIVLTGITNPSTIGSYQLLAKTNVENTFVNSSSYSLAVLASPITIPNTPVLTVNADTVNTNSSFSIPFTLLAGGELTQNSGTITIEFPEGTEFPNSIPNGTITINGNSANTVSINFAQRRLVITTPINLAANVQHTLVISANAGIKNPPHPGVYSLLACTSNQPLYTTTAAYTIVPSINTQIYNLGLTVTPSTSDTPLRWTWTMSTGDHGALQPGKGELRLNFDNATNLSSVSKFDLTVNGVNPVSVRDSLTYLILRIPANLTVKNNGALTIVLNEAANVQIPSSNNKALPKKSGSNSPKSQDVNDYSASSSSEPNETQLQINPLPVELADLSVCIEQNQQTGLAYASIKWATLSESENFGFKIMRRKIDSNVDEVSKKVTANWDEVTFLNGQGYSLERIDYHHDDISISEAGDYQYQIVQIDFSGKTETFGPVEVSFESPKQFALFNNFPNPFNPTTTIPYSVARTSKVSIVVYDILGRRVQTLLNQEVNPGNYTQSFDATHIASGVYIIQMRAEGKVFNKKMMLIK
ncbi:T9SS type A sorting domain-containing protein, partial [bacterium]